MDHRLDFYLTASQLHNINIITSNAFLNCRTITAALPVFMSTLLV